DGIVDEPVKIVLTLTKSGTDLNFDFTGTDKVTRGPINLALTTTLSSCYVALKHIFPEVPVNGGAFRPTRFNVPEGSLLCVSYPVRFRHFAIRENSGGAGKFRGGCGTTYSFEPWGDCVVSVLGDRVDHVPFGIAGGRSAAPNEVRYRTGNEEHVPPLRSKYEK